MGPSLRSSRALPIRLLLSLAGLLCWALAIPAARAQVHEMGPADSPVRELIVGLKPGGTPAHRAAVRRNAASIRKLPKPLQRGLRAAAAIPETSILHLAEGVRMEGELARLRDNPAVAFVEPNYPLQLFQQPPALPPSDFNFSSQESLANTGQNGGTPGADIRALAAWEQSTGNPALLVAVIDTGIDYLHEDLAPNIWMNPGEIPGNGLDDDGNGYIDDIHGYDFVSDDSDPIDDQEHGTHVAGILGARGNNGVGIAGVCWEVSLIALKAFNERGEGRVSDAIEAIHYAADNGARIINASWGLAEKSFALEQAIAYAAEAGVLIVAAAGNSKTDAPSYPAAFEPVLSVAATDGKDQRALFSNYGPAVDLAAPGQNIFSTLPENSYGPASGTSMACPHVTGAAALVLSRFPHYQAEDVRDILLNSADPIVTDRFIGRGRLNAAAAVRMDQPLPRARLRLPDTVGGEVDLTGTAAGIYFTGYTLRAGAGTAPAEWVRLGASLEPVSEGWLGHFDSSLLPDGPVTVQLVVTNESGETAVAIAQTEVRNTAIHYPMGGDILRAGPVYEVRGTTFGTDRQYRLLVGQGVAPSQWVEIAAGTSRPETEMQLGSWDTSAFAPNHFYSLKLTTSDGTVTNEFQARLIYLDEFLKEGWPQYAPADKDLSVGDWRNLRPADLDGDGQTELVIVEPANAEADDLLKVLDATGNTVWTANLQGTSPDIPAMDDVDGDGRMEIFVEADGMIHGFTAAGDPLPGNWPAPAGAGDLAKVLADLDQDGAMELITYSQDWVMADGLEMRELTVFRSTGELLRQWQVPWCGFTNEVQKIFPAVANLDQDPNLEIVVVSGCNELACYDLNSADPVWIAAAEGALVSSPVIGDLDGNGELDIIVAAAQIMDFEQGGIHVFTSSGQLWNGWPALSEASFFNPPALGDLNRDGRLEIAITTKSDYSLHVLESDSFPLEGWPVRLSRFVLNSSPSIGDLDQNGYPDVILAALGAPDLAPLENDPTWVGGLQAWRYDGSQITLAPNAETGFPIEVTNLRRYEKAASPVLVDLDGNGRLDLVATSVYERSYGTAPAFKYRSSLYAWELPVEMPSRGLDWPMFGHDSANRGAYSLPLVPTNTGPSEVTIAVPDRIALSEDTPTPLHVLKNDLAAEGTSLQLVRITQPSHGRVTQTAPGILFFTPEQDYAGLDEFTYTIRDSAGAESTASVLLKVKFVNDPPIAHSQELEMFKNGSLSITYLATDDENHKVTFRIIEGPKNGELWNYPTVGNYQPFKGFFGTDSFTYAAHDGKKESAPATVTIHVINSNNPPRAFDQSLLTKPNRPLNFTPRASDQDGDPLVFEMTSQPLHGQVLDAGSSFQYLPATNYTGTDSFFFRAFDGSAYSTEAEITVSIITTNSVPLATGSSLTVPPDRPGPILLNASDLDGDELAYILVTEPAHGSLSGTAPEFTYTPAPDYLGPDRFSFMVSDGQAESSVAEISLLVARVNHPPVASGMDLATVTNTPVSFDFLVQDEDDDPLRGVILKGTSHGRLFGLDTRYTYVPEPGYIGMDAFTYKVWDGQRYSTPQTVTIYVAAPVEPTLPFFQSITLMPEGSVELRINVQPQLSFRIEGSTNLVEWIDLSGVVTPENPTFLFYDEKVPGTPRFYRAVVAP